MSQFDRATLLISARSPFARRVRVAFLESEVQFTEKVLNVFDHNPILEKHNPLQRVPVLILESGQEIVDSNYILQAFYDVHRQSPLMPFERDLKLQCLNWSALAAGACEKIVEYFLETLRLTALQDEVAKKDAVLVIKNVLMKLETRLSQKCFLVGSSMTQADIDWVCVIDYLRLRMPFLLDQGSYVNAVNFAKTLGERPAFKKTLPPKAG